MSLEDAVDRCEQMGLEQFCTTHWTVVVSAIGKGGLESEAAPKTRAIPGWTIIASAELDFAKVAATAGRRTLLDWFAQCAYTCREQETWRSTHYFLER